jgi:hypothetical protein
MRCGRRCRGMSKRARWIAQPTSSAAHMQECDSSNRARADARSSSQAGVFRTLSETPAGRVLLERRALARPTRETALVAPN